MAPKSPAKRVTRARAASKKDDGLTGATRNPAASKVSKTTSTRKTKPTKDEAPLEQMQVEELPKKSASRTTTKNSTLAAAPRRRLKVTPLNPTPIEQPAPEPNLASKAKKTTTRSKTITDENPTQTVPPDQNTTSTTNRSRITHPTKSKKEQSDSKELTVPKTRGRPKKGAATKPEVPQEPQVGKATRQPRTRAASSVEPVQEPEPAKPKAKPTKKVTFQDLPEDDKENVPIPARKASTKKDTLATGMRAKPVRKPSTAAKKTIATTRGTRGKVEKPAPRALTPKKIIQVNRPATPDESDEEDELNGAKTPLRDLSLSPKRSSQLAATLSPARKIDFTQSLAAKSSAKDTESTLMSPARRPQAPAEKDVEMRSPLRESPKRGDFAPLFPSALQNVTANTSLMPPTHGNLLQSPKRIQLDASAFSQSAMKPKQSPAKSSLLHSPARRLFSPKKSTPATGKKTFSDIPAGHARGTPEDVAVTSHFRNSVSPQRSGRVHRMSKEELADEMANDMDFDQSVLNVGSPLKVVKQDPFVSVTEKKQDDIDDDIAHAQEEKDNEVPAVAEEMVHDSEAVQAADPAEIAVVLPKNDQQAVIDEMVQDSAAIETASPSEIKVALPAHEHAEDEDANKEECGEQSTVATPRPGFDRRVSEILFRSERTEDEESSEDELAGDKTPARAPPLFRASLAGAIARSRLSTGHPSSVNRNIGFTPLAAQMSDWLTASPEKKAAKKTLNPRRVFSPIAAQHIDGEVIVSRQSTPQQKTPAARLSTAKRQSFVPSASLNESEGGTPNKMSFFEDQMAAHDAEENLEDVQQEYDDNVDMHIEAELSNQRPATGEPQVQAESTQMSEDEGDTLFADQPNGELTTDLINFTNASDTAMVDFEDLAKEAEELHEEDEETDEAYGDENTAPLEAMEVTEMIRHTTAQEQFAEYPMRSLVKAAKPQQSLAGEDVEGCDPSDAAPEPVVAAIVDLDGATQPASTSPPARFLIDLDISTPIGRDFSKPRFINTVVSKVPLRSEGHISPIRMTKKRSRSLSNANQASPPKRAALTPIGKLAPRAASDNLQSPSQCVRSTAPSPAVTTPGQTSFAIDDFGDSTLDGIEMPQDDMMDFEVSNPALTPATVKSTRSVKSTAAMPARTPLRQLGEGILCGAVVYVEVHTTEGADASGVYIDLLTEMGARCVKEWKWNPRTSINAEDAFASGKVGITHVVYKDGGKRTLEKVRDAKGEVWCVGVRWVLDSQREEKWLDETSYVVDHAILPRGGSRRRKSMEPSRLSNVNGTVSTKSGRRTSSAEFMTDAMREDLINTPVRTFLADEGDNETEISSTYNSPTTTMNIKHAGVYSTPTELKGWDPATSATPAPATPAPLNAKRIEADGLKTAPPKQSNKGLFEKHIDGKENGDAKMKLKMKDTRRQTMAWVPRVRSPLGKF